ncbi:hypothetical protein J6590_004781 [Homalodisca vitripennis]|nr:hypothetical protein J6590_004781 [Homalodisca vitripennis]
MGDLHYNVKWGYPHEGVCHTVHTQQKRYTRVRTRAIKPDTCCQKQLIIVIINVIRHIAVITTLPRPDKLELITFKMAAG